MSDDRDDHPSMAEKGLEAAKDVVHSASDRVDEVGQHLREKLDAAKRPENYLQMLKDVTKAAPLGMLAVAFVSGVIFARRRD